MDEHPVSDASETQRSPGVKRRNCVNGNGGGGKARGGGDLRTLTASLTHGSERDAARGHQVPERC